MVSRSPPPSKRGRREDDDDESRCRKKFEKGKEPTAKDADEEPLFNDTKFTVELVKSAFRNLEGVGEAFDIKAHHDVYKEPSVKGLAFRIHRLAEKLENLPVVKRAARRDFFFDDGDDCSHGGETPTN
jgi:ribosomal protein S8E